MLSSFSLSGLTAFEPQDAAGCMKFHRIRSRWSAEGRLLTQTPEDTVEVLREIEAACALPFTGIVNNTNLGQTTTAETVLASVPYADEVSRLMGIPVRFTCCAAALEPELRGKCAALFPLAIQKLYYQLDG